MIIAWMAYALLVSLLLGAAALSLESIAHRCGLPTRVLWLGALLGAFALPSVARLLPAPPPAPAPPLPASLGEVVTAPGVSLPGLRGSVGGPGQLETGMIEPLLLVGWGVASAALLVVALTSAVRLRRQRRKWREVEVAGRRVLVSRRAGPAATGLLRTRIVLPSWTLRLPAGSLELILAHEEEHVRKLDPQLIYISWSLLLLAPWNLPLWWIVARLRRAVEVDCDARVLARGADPRRYGTLLLEMGRTRSGGAFLLPAMAEPSSLLEGRIRMMTLKKKPASPGTSLMAVSLAAALTAGACATPRPALPPESAPRSTSIELAPPPEQVALAPDTARPLAEQPAFTPYDIAPSVENTREVRTLLERHYPPMLRDAGIGGTTMLWVFVNESGEVRTTRVVQSSGTLELDAAAEAVIRGVRFSPAVRDGRAVPVWIQLPVSFSARDPRAAEPQRVRSARELATDVAPVRARDFPRDTTAETPAFTPYDAAPELRDRTALSRGLETVYPRLLRDAGIGGTVVLWVRIDDEGRVRNTRVVRSSGYDELDQAAQVALRSAEFAPARHAGRPVAVWIQLPVTFQARGSSSNR